MLLLLLSRRRSRPVTFAVTVLLPRLNGNQVGSNLVAQRQLRFLLQDLVTTSIQE